MRCLLSQAKDQSAISDLTLASPALRASRRARARLMSTAHRRSPAKQETCARTGVVECGPKGQPSRRDRSRRRRVACGGRPDLDDGRDCRGRAPALPRLSGRGRRFVRAVDPSTRASAYARSDPGGQVVTARSAQPRERCRRRTRLLDSPDGAEATRARWSRIPERHLSGRATLLVSGSRSPRRCGERACPLFVLIH